MQEKIDPNSMYPKKRLMRIHIVGALILLVVAYIIVNGNPYIKSVRQASSQTMFDMKLGHTVESAHIYLNDLGETGRSAYVRFSLLIDMIFPVIYSSVFFIILLFLKQRITAPGKIFKNAIFFPFLAGISDIIENISIIILIKTYPKELPITLFFLNKATLVKWSAIILSLLIIILSIVLLIVQNQKKRESEKKEKK